MVTSGSHGRDRLARQAAWSDSWLCMRETGPGAMRAAGEGGEMGRVGGTMKLSEHEADRAVLWNAKDVAAFLKVSRSWVYHHAEAGLLPCLRVGALLRFDPRAVHAFAYGQAQEGLPTDPKGGA